MVYLLLREEKWESPSKGLKEKLASAQIGGVGVMVMPVPLQIMMGEVKTTQRGDTSQPPLKASRGGGKSYRWF